MAYIIKYSVKCLKIFFIGLGIFSTLLIILSFTSVPYWTRYWLGTQFISIKDQPEYIIMLGGSGMPSEDNLIRIYHTSDLATKFEKTTVIIAHPKDSEVYSKMRYEMGIRCIDLDRIIFEFHGTNTRSQVQAIFADFPKLISSNIIVVTAPEQVYRTVLTFQKSGFKNISGIPAFNSDMHVDLSYNTRKLGGSNIVPDVGNKLQLRYNFWNYLKTEISCLREFAAIGYYKLNGWI
jgi:uncharacterized SAM-binding protein YcdF (DUF218 family)